MKPNPTNPPPQFFQLDAPPGRPILRAGGAELADEARAELAKAVRAGQGPSKLECDVIAYVQGSKPNRNHLTFAPAALASFAASFVGTPVLDGHRQGGLEHRLGRVLASELVDHPEGKAIRQTWELTNPRAIEAAARGEVDRASIGWSPGPGDPSCTACNKPMWSAGGCTHFPGDTLPDGGVVQALYSRAMGVEVSVVSVPAVPSAIVEGMRAALSAFRTGEESTVEALTAALAEERAAHEATRKLLAAAQGVANLPPGGALAAWQKANPELAAAIVLAGGARTKEAATHADRVRAVLSRLGADPAIYDKFCEEE